MQKYNTKDFWRILHRLFGMAAVTLAAMLFLVMGLYVDTGAAAKKSLKKPCCPL